MDGITKTLLTFAENSFPVAVAMYLLFRTEKRIDSLTSAVKELLVYLRERNV
jgi:hypothetical protein